MEQRGGGFLTGNTKYDKDLPSFFIDGASEAMGIGMGKLFDKSLGIGSQSSIRNKAIYRRGGKVNPLRARGWDEALGSGLITNFSQLPIDIGGYKALDYFNRQMIMLDPVEIRAKRINENRVRTLNMKEIHTDMDRMMNDRTFTPIDID